MSEGCWNHPPSPILFQKMKECTKCKRLLPLDCFVKDSSRKSGIYPSCKECNHSRINHWHKDNPEKIRANIQKWSRKNRGQCNHYLATYRTKKAQAIPIWYEDEKIRLVYKKAKELGMAVDHIVPLNSPTVCGLHCWANLQLLGKSMNSSKGNKYWPDMPEEPL